MAVKYQTGISTLAQFVTITFLNIVSLVITSVQGCVKSPGDCVGDTTLNLLYLLVLAGWFAFLWVLGYATQDRRSKRLAQLLIAAETVVFLAAALDAKHHPDILGLLTSLADLGFAALTILLAWRIWHAKGGRVTARPRRQRVRRSSQ